MRLGYQLPLKGVATLGSLPAGHRALATAPVPRIAFWELLQLDDHIGVVRATSATAPIVMQARAVFDGAVHAKNVLGLKHSPKK